MLPISRLTCPCGVSSKNQQFLSRNPKSEHGLKQWNIRFLIFWAGICSNYCPSNFSNFMKKLFYSLSFILLLHSGRKDNDMPELPNTPCPIPCTVDCDSSKQHVVWQTALWGGRGHCGSMTPLVIGDKVLFSQKYCVDKEVLTMLDNSAEKLVLHLVKAKREGWTIFYFHPQYPIMRFIKHTNDVIFFHFFVTLTTD